MDRFELRWIDPGDGAALESLREFARAQPLDRAPLLASLDQPCLAERSRLFEVLRGGRRAAVGARVEGVFPYPSAPIFEVVPGAAAAVAAALARPFVAYAGERTWSELVHAGGRELTEELQMARLVREPLGDPDPRVERLSDYDELARFSERAISRVHFECGPYFGVRDDSGKLISIGGVQLVTDTVAQLGGIATSAEARRQGLARAVTSELIRTLEEKGRSIVLHVRVDNHSAIRLYAALGFRGRRRIRLYQF